MKRRKFGWRAIVTLIALIALTATMGILAPKASSQSVKAAGSSYLFNQHGYQVYVAPCLDKIYGKLCLNGYWFENGRKVTMICWLDSKYPATGNYSSKRWFYIDISLDHGLVHRQYYVHSSYVYYQTTVGHC